MNWLILSVDIEQDLVRGQSPGKPFFCFLHLLRSIFSSTNNLLLGNMFWRTLHSKLSLCYVVERLDEYPTFQRTVCYKQVEKCFDLLSQVK